MKFVLDEKRTKLRNLTFWTKKQNSQFRTKFGRKNGQLIAEPNVICDQGTSKRPSCVECRWHLLVRCDTGTAMSIKYGACLCSTCNMLDAQYKISADIKSTLTFQ